jgi:hypothetical protein
VFGLTAAGSSKDKILGLVSLSVIDLFIVLLRNT